MEDARAEVAEGCLALQGTVRDLSEQLEWVKAVNTALLASQEAFCLKYKYLEQAGREAADIVAVLMDENKRLTTL